MSDPSTSGSSLPAPGSGLRALAHPLRLQMLSLMTGAPHSAAELGRELRVSQALASYHLRQLRQAGLLELVEERIRRGGRERRYMYRLDPERSDPPFDDQGTALVGEGIAVELRRRSRAAEPGYRGVGVDAELWVHPDDWTAAQDAVRAAAIALHERARPPRAPGSIRVSMSAALFRMSSADRGASDG